jgi:Ca2+-binding RTX toxin-like protein
MKPCDLVQRPCPVMVRIHRRGSASAGLRAPLNDIRTVLLVGVVFALPVPRCAAQATISGTRSFFENGRTTETVFTVSAVGDGADDAIRSTLLHDASGVADGAQVTDVAGAVASEGCEQVDPTTVRCVLPVMGPPPFIEIDLDGGPGNDLLVGDGVTEELRGGPGDDVLDGSRQPHGRLDGGPGADRLIAPAPTPSAPFGGPLMDGGAGADVMTGNGLVAYDGRQRGIRVDLRSRAPVQGAPGEGDVIDGPNGVIGGDGGDVLIAGKRRAELQGGDGADRLVGGPRSDVILGDAGSDVIRGGGGADELLGGNTRDGDRISGGPGADRVLASPGADVLTGNAGADSVLGVGRGDVVRVRGGGADIVACDHPPARAWVDGLDLVLGCPRATVSRRGVVRPRIL